MNFVILVAMTMSGFLIGTQAINCYSCHDYSQGNTVEKVCQDADIVTCHEVDDRCYAMSLTYGDSADVTDSVSRFCVDSSVEVGDANGLDCNAMELNIMPNYPEGTPFSCEEQICESDACNTLGQERFQ